jgi:predicted alpha/beta hydrolase
MTFTYAYQFFTPSGALAARIHRDVQDLVTPRPTVAVTGSWLTVKEQMPDRYARALAQRGFTAVTFDFSGFGISPGTPAQVDFAVDAVTRHFRAHLPVAEAGSP